MFWPTPSSARASSRFVELLHPLRGKARQRSQRNIAAGRPRATRRCWPIARSRRSSTPRRTMCIWRPQAPPPPRASTSSSTSRSPTRVADGRAITEACRKAGVVLALGYQRRRESHFRWIRQQIDAGVFGKLVNAEANISRDRLGKIDLTSWRYQAAGMPGGVMLQIGIHYIDVLEYLIGPVHAVRGQSAQLVLPGDNPDVASLILEHENGALSTLNASYASASEYYLMNIYGKDATAYYDLHNGLAPAQARREHAGGGAMRQERHARRGAGGVCGSSSWTGPARSRAASTRRNRSRWCAPAFSRRGRDAGSRSRRYWRVTETDDRATARTGVRHETGYWRRFQSRLSSLPASCRRARRTTLPGRSP